MPMPWEQSKQMGNVKMRIAKRMRRLALPVLVLALAACSDTSITGPGDVGEISAKRTGISFGGPAQVMLRHASFAPALKTYQVSAWMVKGEARTIRVDYAGSAKPFLQLHVPAGGLAARPNGTPMVDGDSVLVTVSIDPVDFEVQFAPAGLAFDKNAPAQIVFGYAYADPDVDRDGDVDSDDGAILQNALSVFQSPDGGSNWASVASSNNRVQKTVTANVGWLSNYALSWTGGGGGPDRYTSGYAVSW